MTDDIPSKLYNGALLKPVFSFKAEIAQDYHDAQSGEFPYPSFGKVHYK